MPVAAPRPTHPWQMALASNNGIITTVAGTGSCCSGSGDGGLALSAVMGRPTAIALSSVGDMYIAACYSYQIRKVISWQAPSWKFSGSEYYCYPGQFGWDDFHRGGDWHFRHYGKRRSRYRSLVG